MSDRNHQASSGRLATLRTFLESDPDNLNLLADAAEAALAEDDPAAAAELLERYGRTAPLPEREQNLAGIAAMQSGAFDRAIEVFRPLKARHGSDPALRFNLAWSLAMMRTFNEALDLLDQPTIDALGQAAALRVQLLHDQGMFEEAEKSARHAIRRHPDHPGLLGAVSILAMDIDDMELARTTASRAGDQPEALITLGTLSLGADEPEAALKTFERVLQRVPNAPRAWIGKGLAELANGAQANAVESLRHGAELFGEHVGSWIAAGWACILVENLAEAERCFRRAADLDHNFAESQGSLAVVKLMIGDVDEGRRLAQIAARLDPKSFSGSLANALVLAGSGRPDLARAIVSRAMTTPIDETGRTLAQAVSRFALGR